MSSAASFYRFARYKFGQLDLIDLKEYLVRYLLLATSIFSIGLLAAKSLYGS